jgi:protein-disulfide isomerase
MSAQTRHVDRALTVAAVLAIPLLVVALWNGGRRIVSAIDGWYDTRARRALVDSVITNTPSRLTFGSQQAREVILAFSDYQCPACRVADSLLMLALNEDSRLAVITMHFPLEDIHPEARAAAVAAVCAERQDRFADVHHALFRERIRATAPSFWALAAAKGVRDSARFADCVASAEAAAAVDAEVAVGARLGVIGTPTFVTRNGDRFGLGAVLQKLPPAGASSHRPAERGR